MVVQSTGVYGDFYTSLDGKHKVTSEYLSKYSLSEVLNGLVKKTVFGTGFPIVYRRYPVIKVFDDRIIIFDPSEQ